MPYIMRRSPEAIESVCYFYQISGDKHYLDKAWDIFSAIRNITCTDIANATVKDVTFENPEQTDRMETIERTKNLLALLYLRD